MISFPVHRIKNMLKRDPEMKRKFRKKDFMVITKASELFAEFLATKAFKVMQVQKKKTL